MPLTSPCRQAQAQEQSHVHLLEALGVLQEDQLEAVVALWRGTEAESKGPAGPGGWQNAETHPGLLDSGGGGGSV